MTQTPDQFHSWGDLPTAANPQARQPGDTDPALLNAATPSVFQSVGEVATKQPPPPPPAQSTVPPNDESGVDDG